MKYYNRYQTSAKTLLLALLVIVPLTCAEHGEDVSTVVEKQDEEVEMAHVLVGLNDLVATTWEEETVIKSQAYGPHKLTLTEFVTQYGGKVTTELKTTHTVALTLPKTLLNQLEQDTTFVENLEFDELVYPFQSDTNWANRMVGSDTANIPTAPAKQIGNASCFKICVVDAGLLVSHPDIPWNLGSPYVAGTQLGLPSNQKWFNPVNEHGTHVSGIMVAAANNSGMQGVIPNAKNICMLVARVFPDNASEGQRDSVILDGVEWCANQGARVINMSLGAAHHGTAAAKAVYSRVAARGALIVSASGNDGGTALMYPASFDTVISVAALDKNEKRATFSQYNAKVDLAAPGELIKSTIPSAAIKDGNGNKFDAMVMAYSATPNTPITAAYVNCGAGTRAGDCGNASGKICIFSRNPNTFAEKARVCQNAGGVGAIIVNNYDSVFSGTIGPNSGIRIPVVGISSSTGVKLRQNSARATMTFIEPGYREMSGTSMATAYVSGIAARIWSLRPQCTNEQVKRALFISAKNLGNSNFYGKGLVRTQQAYNALLTMPAPCGTGATASNKSVTSYVGSTVNSSPTRWSSWSSKSWRSGTVGSSWSKTAKEERESIEIHLKGVNRRLSKSLRGVSDADK